MSRGRRSAASPTAPSRWRTWCCRRPGTACCRRDCCSASRFRTWVRENRRPRASVSHSGSVRGSPDRVRCHLRGLVNRRCVRGWASCRRRGLGYQRRGSLPGNRRHRVRSRVSCRPRGSASGSRRRRCDWVSCRYRLRGLGNRRHEPEPASCQPRDRASRRRGSTWVSRCREWGSVSCRPRASANRHRLRERGNRCRRPGNRCHCRDCCSANRHRSRRRYECPMGRPRCRCHYVCWTGRPNHRWRHRESHRSPASHHRRSRCRRHRRRDRCRTRRPARRNHRPGYRRPGYRRRCPHRRAS